MKADGCAAVIVAAGGGTRMGGVDKGALLLDGRTVLGYSVRALRAVVDQLVVVVARARLAAWEEIAGRESWPQTAFVQGGETRMQSARAGIDALRGRTDTDLVAIHDGARPLVTPALARAALEVAALHGASTLATPVTDTIKRVAEGMVIDTPDRATLWAAQTPQAFRLGVLRAAFAWATREARDWTDEAGMVEAFGHPVAIARGDRENVKITESADLALVESLLSQRGERSDAE